MKKSAFVLLFILFKSLSGFAQGCIPIRNISGFGQFNFTDNAFSTSNWQVNITGRYFRSFRDFKEKNDQKTAEQNESVNKVYTADPSISKIFAHGWSVILDVPLTSAARTSSFEHGGANTTRHTTSSFGIGDIRFTAYKWLLRPSPTQKWNIQLGLGLKLPTGAYNYQDYFYRNDTTKVLSAINPSIQPGDGGTGIITELITFYVVSKAINLFGDFYYMANPRNENGTLYTMGKTPTPLQLMADAVNNSVPDVFSLHAGVSLNVGKLSVSAAVKDEGTPVHDFIGHSDGARRAGYYLSAEPGLVYRMKKVSLFGYVPVIVKRSIRQNVPDKNVTAITGVYTVGAGGSANYSIIGGVSFKL